MALFLQRLLDGLSEGSIYALLALGLVIIYRGTGHLNFAQGEMALFSTYVVYQMGEWGIPIGFAVVIGVVVGFLLGAVTEVALAEPNLTVAPVMKPVPVMTTVVPPVVGPDVGEIVVTASRIDRAGFQAPTPTVRVTDVDLAVGARPNIAAAVRLIASTSTSPDAAATTNSPRSPTVSVMPRAAPTSS